MRVTLIHAPPWKIPSPGESFLPGEGPPRSADSALINDGDFCTLPYGLLSLAAQLRKEGMEAEVINLSNWLWKDIIFWAKHCPADVFGISCLSVNRRGVTSLANLLRLLHPSSHIVLGGPHATALPREILEHCPAIDSIVLGEGEQTFLELIARLKSKKELLGLQGAAFRMGTKIEIGPPRERINELDSLASPLDYYSSHIILSSRGCPGQCTFCDSESMWQRKVRFHSAGYVLDMLDTAVNKHAHRFLCIKDDTFTANKARVLEICRGIETRGLKFVWSCDTRADALDQEVLRAMRLAGCRLLSLGVESGSQEILNNIKKRITPEQVLEATALAKSFGFQVRYYMMWGNRGETIDTFRQSLALIQKGRPHQVIFTLLSVYPGTKEFALLEQENVFQKEIFFSADFPTLKCFLGKQEDFAVIRQEVERLGKQPGYYQYTEEESRNIVKHLPNLPEAYLDYAAACCRSGNYPLAEQNARLALELGYPLPGLALNCLGCIAAAKGNFADARSAFSSAVQIYPHAIALSNLQTLNQWLAQGGVASKSRMLLMPDCSFETNWLQVQPEKPVPVDRSSPSN